MYDQKKIQLSNITDSNMFEMIGYSKVVKKREVKGDIKISECLQSYITAINKRDNALV